MKPLFTAEDFYICDDIVDGKVCTREHEISLSDKDCAEIANAKLREMLKDAPVIYVAKGYGHFDMWTIDQSDLDGEHTHTARMVDIKEIEKMKLFTADDFISINPRTSQMIADLANTKLEEMIKDEPFFVEADATGWVTNVREGIRAFTFDLVTLNLKVAPLREENERMRELLTRARECVWHYGYSLCQKEYQKLCQEIDAALGEKK